MKFFVLAFLVLVGALLLGILLGISSRKYREAPLSGDHRLLAVSKAKVMRVVIRVAAGNERDHYEADIHYSFTADSQRSVFAIGSPHGFLSLIEAYEYLKQFVPDGTPFEFSSYKEGSPAFWVPSAKALEAASGFFVAREYFEYFGSKVWLEDPYPIVEIRHLPGKLEINQWNRMKLKGWMFGVFCGLGTIGGAGILILLTILHRAGFPAFQWWLLCIVFMLASAFVASIASRPSYAKLGPPNSEPFKYADALGFSDAVQSQLSTW